MDLDAYAVFRMNQGLYNLGEGHENIQEGKVIGWKLKLSRYLDSMEKNTMIHD